MSFHFVDRIYEYEPRRHIRGVKNVTRNEGLFYWLPNGQRVLSPAVVTEALCQLGGWLKMASTDFQRRPVLLGDEMSLYHGVAEAGDQIELFVETIDFGDDVVITRGEAKIDGRPILTGQKAMGYLLPLADFDDPERVRHQFNNLLRPDLKAAPRIAPGTRLKPLAGAGAFDALRLVDGIVEHVPGKKVVSYKNVSACEPYFATHFPYKPCVPGVMLLTFMGETCQYLVKDELEAPVRGKVMLPTFNRNVRFRKFVEPGDQIVLEATVQSGDAAKHGEEIVVKAIISANGNRVMQAELGFRTMFASAFAAKPDSSARAS
jgi:3-hydroxyacyl-[acyl-carrier-protein] dehydratase